MIYRDDGPGGVSGAIQNWAEKAGIALQYIQPSQPGKKHMLNAASARSAMSGQDSAAGQNSMKSETPLLAQYCTTTVVA